LTIAPALSQKAPGLVTEFVTAMDAKSYRWERRSPNVLMETIQRVVGKINRIMLASNCAFDQVIDYTCFHIVESPARDEGIETKNAAE
jgi:hypothetical protein